MLTVLFLGECVPPAASHYRARLREYDPPVASTLMARCKSSICCCISASVPSIFLLEQCRNELIAHGVDGSSTNAPRTRPILSVCAIASEPLIQGNDRVVQSVLAPLHPGCHGCRALRRLGRCGRRRQHGRLQLINSLLDVCFRRSKPVSHHLHGLVDRFLHPRDLFFGCHHVSPS